MSPLRQSKQADIEWAYDRAREKGGGGLERQRKTAARERRVRGRGERGGRGADRGAEICLEQEGSISPLESRGGVVD